MHAAHQWPNYCINRIPRSYTLGISIQVVSFKEITHGLFWDNAPRLSGADIVLDKKLGPLILDINARPGLAIQIANQIGLTHRLKAIEQLEVNEFGHTSLSIEERVNWSIDNF